MSHSALMKAWPVGVAKTILAVAKKRAKMAVNFMVD